jgi:hypothetical protein
MESAQKKAKKNLKPKKDRDDVAYFNARRRHAGNI